MSQDQNLDDWEQRYDELFPNGLTQEEVEEANREMWENAYPTQDMQEDTDKAPKPIRIVKR